MKIVHVIPTLDPAAGGPPQVALRLAAAQGAMGHEVHLLSYSTTSHREIVEQEIERVPHHRCIVFHFLVDPGRIELLVARQARRILRELSLNSNFIHIHGVWGTILKTAAQVARSNGVAYCIQPHGMLDPWSLAQKRWKKKVGLALGYRAALSSSSFVCALNSDEKRLIEPLELGAQTLVLPNGVFIEEIEPLPILGTFRAAHPELGSAPYVLFLSRLHYKKGLDVLADAFALLGRQREDVHLVVVGPDEGAREAFVRRVADAGLASRVHVVGPLYGRDKFAALVDATCFCLPSRQEGFSVAVTEAMACGLPVVISEACHFPEVAEAGAGTIVPLEAASLAAALGTFVADVPRAGRIGATGAALVRERYTWGAIAQRSIGLYRDATQ